MDVFLAWTAIMIFIGGMGYTISNIADHQLHKAFKQLPFFREQAKLDPSDPWARWKADKDKLAKYRAEQKADWDKTYNLILRATCTHMFPGTSQSPNYYTCQNCGYEEPWEYVEGCNCVKSTVHTFETPNPTYELIHRSGTCKWHGRDWEHFGKMSDRTAKPFKSNEIVQWERDLASKVKEQRELREMNSLLETKMKRAKE